MSLKIQCMSQLQVLVSHAVELVREHEALTPTYRFVDLQLEPGGSFQQMLQAFAPML
jgi:hypothetical protein